MGLRIPVFVRSRWFKRHGCEDVDRDGMMELMLKTFVPGVDRPSFIRSRKKIDGGAASRGVAVKVIAARIAVLQSRAVHRGRTIARSYPPAAFSEPSDSIQGQTAT
ncbi:MAG: hypothetical protein ACOYM2_17175 [Rectinemataceae bacterium]